MRTVGKILLWLLAAIGMLVTVPTLAFVAYTALHGDDPPAMPDSAILELDWNAPIPERYATHPPFKPVLDATVLETVQAIDRAADLPQVQALAVRLGDAPMGFARVQELAAAIRRFRATGKKTYAFAADLSGFGDGTPEVLLAAAFDEVWLQPSGTVGLTGIALEMPFAAEGLNEIGLSAQFEQRHEFKGGADPLTRTGMSDPVRASLQDVADGLLRQAADAIATDRGMPVDAVLGLIDTGPHLARDALAAGLVDRLGYEAEFDAMLDALDDGARRIGAPFLLAATAPSFDDTMPSTVAVLYGLGPIGVSSGSLSDPGFDSDTLIALLNDIALGGVADAVLLRIDSPGGAYGPSDAVWYAVSKVRDAGIPVVVSMGDMAASGGYFAAAAADRIVAHPATLTGSIGVYGGKFDAAGFWDNLGVRWEQVTAGRNAGMWSPNRPFDLAERRKFAAGIDFVYEDFTTKVSEARGLDAARLDAAARGRIWLGDAAVDAGLVDRLGGYREALMEVRSLLSLPDDAPLALTVMPEPKSPLEVLETLAESGDFSVALGDWVADTAERRISAHIDRTVGGMDELILRPQGLLTTPPFRLRR